MTIGLFLFEDDVSPASALVWGRAPRAVYVRSGAIRVADDGASRALGADMCALFTGALEISGDAQIWTFELSSRPVAALDAAQKPRVVLAHDVDLDPTSPILFRADKVSFPPGAVTPRHGHKGAGIRRLVHGRLLAEIGSELRLIPPGGAWFETGQDPVVGRNLAPASAFVRALALDPSLKGLPTFIPWTPEDAAKPRGTKPVQFFDEIVVLPTPDGAGGGG